MSDDKVVVFIRPKVSPQFTLRSEQIRVAYGCNWVDFRDGRVLVRDEAGKEKIPPGNLFDKQLIAGFLVNSETEFQAFLSTQEIEPTEAEVIVDAFLDEIGLKRPGAYNDPA